MLIEKTGMFCLNSTMTRKDEDTAEQTTGVVLGANRGEAAATTRIDNFELTDEQAAKIKEIHERHAAEINAVLGW